MLFKGGKRRWSVFYPVPAGGHSPHPREAMGSERRGGVRLQVFQKPGRPHSSVVLSSLFQVKPSSIQILAGGGKLVLNHLGKSVNPFGFHLKNRVIVWHTCLQSASVCGRLSFPNKFFQSHAGLPPRGAVCAPLPWTPSRPL